MSDSTNEELEAMIAEARGRALVPHEAEDLGVLADLLGDPSTWAEPRAGLEDEIVHAIGTAPAPSAGTAPLPVRAKAANRSRRFRTLAAAVAVAAAILVAIPIAGTLRKSNTDFDGRLSAAALAPSARGSVDITKNDAGFRVRLDVRGLPKLAAGEYYQAWLKSAAGVSVPIGTFSSSDSRVTLWSGVSPKAFPTLTVTKEKTDNDQKSSGLLVLTAELQAN